MNYFQKFISNTHITCRCKSSWCLHEEQLAPRALPGVKTYDKFLFFIFSRDTRKVSQQKKGEKTEGDHFKKRNTHSYGHFVLIERLTFCRQKYLLCKVTRNYTLKFLVGLMFLYSDIEWSRLHSNLPNPMITWIKNYNWPH
jgi:hypothetical protein